MAGRRFRRDPGDQSKTPGWQEALPASCWRQPAVPWTNTNQVWPLWSAAQWRHCKHSIQKGRASRLTGKDSARIWRGWFYFPKWAVSPCRRSWDRSREEEGSASQKTQELQLQGISAVLSASCQAPICFTLSKAAVLRGCLQGRAFVILRCILES